MKGAFSSPLCWFSALSVLSICDVVSSPLNGQVTGNWELVRPAVRLVGRESQDSAQQFGVVAGAFIR